MSSHVIQIDDSDQDMTSAPSVANNNNQQVIFISGSESDNDIIVEQVVVNSGVEFVSKVYRRNRRTTYRRRKKRRVDTSDANNNSTVDLRSHNTSNNSSHEAATDPKAKAMTSVKDRSSVGIKAIKNSSRLKLTSSSSFNSSPSRSSNPSVATNNRISDRLATKVGSNSSDISNVSDLKRLNTAKRRSSVQSVQSSQESPNQTIDQSFSEMYIISENDLLESSLPSNRISTPTSVSTAFRDEIRGNTCDIETTLVPNDLRNTSEISNTLTEVPKVNVIPRSDSCIATDDLDLRSLNLQDNEKNEVKSNCLKTNESQNESKSQSYSDCNDEDSSNELELDCTHCSEKFYDELDWYLHVSRHIRDEAKKGNFYYKCNFEENCNFECATQTELMYHNSEHLGEFVCRDINCKYSTTTKQLLAQHTERHKNAKPIKRKNVFCNCGEKSCLPKAF